MKLSRSIFTLSDLGFLSSSLLSFLTAFFTIFLLAVGAGFATADLAIVALAAGFALAGLMTAAAFTGVLVAGWALNQAPALE